MNEFQAAIFCVYYMITVGLVGIVFSLRKVGEISRILIGTYILIVAIDGFWILGGIRLGGTDIYISYLMLFYLFVGLPTLLIRGVPRFVEDTALSDKSLLIFQALIFFISVIFAVYSSSVLYGGVPMPFPGDWVPEKLLLE